MREEFITKSIMKWLEKRDWEIISFDFPQSGTGYSIRPNNSKKKVEDSITPDIISLKNDICLIFENKNRFYLKDFEKIDELRNSLSKFSDSFNSLFGGKMPTEMHCGIGIPYKKKHIKKAKKHLKKIDFLVSVSKKEEIYIIESGSVKMWKSIDNIFGKPITKEKRSSIMSKIKSTGSKLEQNVFSALEEAGFTFEKHYSIKGTPDAAWPDKKIALFVDSDFWHGWNFEEKKEDLKPFWKNKIKRNRERDKEVNLYFEERGWKVIRIWEHELDNDYEGTIGKLITKLNKNLN